MPPRRAQPHHGMRARTGFFTCPDQHSYHLNRIMKGGRWSLQCIFLRVSRCHGRASMRPDGTAFKATQRHNHRPHRGIVLLRRLRRCVLQRCLQRDQTPFKHILTQEIVRLRVPRNLAATLPYSRLRPAMLRARLKSFPRLPHTLTAMAAILETPQNTNITASIDGRDNIYLGSFGNDADRTKCAIFVSRRFLEYMSEVRKVFSDGTFDPIPSCLLNDVKQVWNICTSWDFHTVPLVRVLMQSKLETAYRVVLQALKQASPNFQPRTVKADFERAQINAWREEFPLARVSGCLFHYVQKVGSKPRRFGLLNLIQEDEEIDDIIRSMCAIPLLPTHMFGRAFRELIEAARRLPEWNVIRPMFVYLRRTWMTPATRNILSVYRSVDRTNNVSESDNNQMRIELRQVHPNLWIFMDGLRNMEEESYMDLMVLRRGGDPGFGRRSSSVFNDQRILRLTNNLDAGRIGVLQFLKEASYSVARVYQRGLNGER